MLNIGSLAVRIAAGGALMGGIELPRDAKDEVKTGCAVDKQRLQRGTAG
jgi:hypothetical protein